jgi:hypothetical protein
VTVRRGLAAALLVVASASCAPAAPCAPVEGGDPDALMQLRRLSFGDDQLSLLFALRPGSPYGVPAHAVTSSGDRIRVRVPGARLRHTDGTSVFFGSTEPDPPPGRFRSVTVTDEADGTVVVDIALEGGACARVASRAYALGTTFSAALVSIALRDGPVVALDPDHAAPGAAAQVIGTGFAPDSPATFQVDGRTVWSSETDENGDLDTVLFMPERPGPHAALVRDRSRSALAWFVVAEEFRR